MTAAITLTTDFGAAGPFVAMMKAVLQRYAPQAPLIDLTHQVAPCDPGEAGFWIARSWAWFPAGSVHVAVVDPGVGTARAILAAAHGGHLFLAPDNGILPMIVPAGTPLHALAADWPGRRDWPQPARTFHGRDIFAPLAAALWSASARPADIGPQVRHPVPGAVPAARRQGDAVTGRVVALDNWGNLITNIDAGLIAGLPSPRISLDHRDIRLFDTYGDAPPGALLALVNSLGVVEIAWREGNAAALLGMGRGATVTVRAGT